MLHAPAHGWSTTCQCNQGEHPYGPASNNFFKIKYRLEKGDTTIKVITTNCSCFFKWHTDSAFIISEIEFTFQVAWRERAPELLLLLLLKIWMTVYVKWSRRAIALTAAAIMGCDCAWYIGSIWRGRAITEWCCFFIRWEFDAEFWFIPHHFCRRKQYGDLPSSFIIIQIPPR